MASSRPGIGNATFETVVAFLAALLVFPLLIKLVIGTMKSVFRLGVVRRLLVESALIGLTTLLTKEGVLDKLFGEKGRRGDGVLKPDVDR
jgi:hypothetical protein